MSGVEECVSGNVVFVEPCLRMDFFVVGRGSGVGHRRRCVRHGSEVVSGFGNRHCGLGLGRSGGEKYVILSGNSDVSTGRCGEEAFVSERVDVRFGVGVNSRGVGCSCCGGLGGEGAAIVSVI